MRGFADRVVRSYLRVEIAMNNHTQPSQQVPVAMTDEDIVTLACKHNLPNGAIWEDWYGGDNMMVRPQLVAFARALLAQSATANAEDTKLRQDVKNALCIDGYLNIAHASIMRSDSPDGVFCILGDLARKAVDMAFDAALAAKEQP
jgi:hypothetical protein